MNERPPKFIREAIEKGDTETLSQAGRKGAEKANQKRQLAQAIAELERQMQADIDAQMDAETFAQDEAARKRATNEDILTPDGDDPTDGFYLID